jgi:histone-lysine N-methyltransferase SETD3
VEPYQTIVAIPLRCLITDHMGRTQTDIGRVVFSKRNTLSTPNLLAVVIYILETREDPDDFFQPYYDVLPQDYTNFPIFWDQDKLDWLKGSPLLQDIQERNENMKGDYDELCVLCPEFSRFSFEEFLEVRTAVGSRNFGIVVDGEKRTAMVPHADMLNHYRPRETSWTFDNSRQCFTITSLSSLVPGQQVMDSYGKKCNSKFLLHYGFAVEVNREEDGKCQNELLITLSVLPETQDPLRSTKLSVLGPARASRSFRISMNIEDKATMDAFSYLRVIVANEEELSTIMSLTARQHLSSSRVHFVNERNEAAALELLASTMQAQLARYPNTYKDNLALLSSGQVKPFTDRRTALVVILGEQEICEFWINAHASVVGPLLRTLSGVSLQAALKHLPRETDTARDQYRYATTVLSALRNKLSAEFKELR